MAVRAVIDANVLMRGLLAAEGPPRWRNTAQWARNDLREQGLIRDDTPRSIWEITD
jgi:restriction system protein